MYEVYKMARRYKSIHFNQPLHLTEHLEHLLLIFTYFDALTWVYCYRFSLWIAELALPDIFPWGYTCTIRWDINFIDPTTVNLILTAGRGFCRVSLRPDFMSETVTCVIFQIWSQKISWYDAFFIIWSVSMTLILQEGNVIAIHNINPDYHWNVFC